MTKIGTAQIKDGLGVCKFRIHDKKQVSYVWEKALSYLHFTNIYVIIRNLLYRNQLEGEKRLPLEHPIPDHTSPRQLFLDFTSRDITRAAVMKRKGGKHATRVTRLQEALEGWQLYEDFQNVGSNLQAKNFYKVFQKIESSFKGFYTKQKNGDCSARPPKTKKLSQAHGLTIPIDQDCLSLKKQNKIRVNINSKMIDLPLNHQQIEKIVGSLDAVQSAELYCSPTELVVSLLYKKTVKTSKNTIPIPDKAAGLDLGVKNVAAVFIDDKATDSFLVSGQELIRFNARNNRHLAKLKSERDLETAKQAKPEGEDSSRHQLLKERISRLYTDRREFFHNQFHKLSRRILEDLSSAEVTDLYVSRNLGNTKNSSGGTMGRLQNQRFYQIPLLKLIDQVTLKANEYGIRVHGIDEAYTSKASSISGDVTKAQVKAGPKNNEENRPKTLVGEERANVLNGTRVRRSLFKDKSLGKCIHADINAAANHIKVGLAEDSRYFMWLQNHLWKLANPVKKHAHHCYLDRQTA